MFVYILQSFTPVRTHTAIQKRNNTSLLRFVFCFLFFFRFLTFYSHDFKTLTEISWIRIDIVATVHGSFIVWLSQKAISKEVTKETVFILVLDRICTMNFSPFLLSIWLATSRAKAYVSPPSLRAKRPTKYPVKPIKPPVKPTKPPVKPVKPPTKPPVVKPTKSPVKPTKTPTKLPTNFPVKPTKLPTYATVNDDMGVDDLDDFDIGPTKAPLKPTKPPVKPTKPPTQSPTICVKNTVDSCEGSNSVSKTIIEANDLEYKSKERTNKDLFALQIALGLIGFGIVCIGILLWLDWIPKIQKDGSSEHGSCNDDLEENEDIIASY